jgi:D-alanyl-D-alanine carboxypeptidase (penicillin-binding protein 5/6)
MPKPGKQRKTFEIYTQDRLLLSYKGAIGIKTGWTTKARGTFIGAATRGGRTLVATVMHSNQSAWKDSAALLDWGFANAEKAQPVGTLDQSDHAAQAASVRHPGASPGRSGRAASVAAGGSAVPGWAWVPIVLFAAVVLLRTRVLVRREIRRRRTRQPLPPRRAF